MSAAGRRPVPSPWVRLDGAGELARCQQRIDEERIASGLGSTYRCCGVARSRGLRNCERRASAWRDGRPWCSVHDPAAGGGRAVARAPKSLREALRRAERVLREWDAAPSPPSSADIAALADWIAEAAEQRTKGAEK